MGAGVGETSEAFERLLARLEQVFAPRQIWLFGSRARGEATSRSDWDLLVVVPDATGREAFHPLTAWRMQKDSGIHADIVLVKESEFAEDVTTANTLPYAAHREGVLLRER